MKNILSIATIVILIAVLFVVVSNKPQEQTSVGGNVWNSTQFNVASTSKTVAVTSDVQLAGSSTPAFQRAYTIICNDSSQVVYIGLNGDKPVTQSNGIRLNANGGCYEINDQNLYTGAIRATSTNETSSNVTINDYTL